MKEKQLLSEENRRQFRKILKRRKKNLVSQHLKQYEASINNELSNNQEEINEVGIIICAFNEEKSPLEYIRTEPLIYFKEKNFDLFFKDKNGIIILISIKGKIFKNELSNINLFREYTKIITENQEINNTLEDKKMKVLDYFEQVIGSKIKDSEFVLATERCSVTKIVEKAKEAKFNFCLWEISERGNKLHICQNVIKGDGSFTGHINTDLNRYLGYLLSKGKIYNKPIAFMFSSSRYWKAIQISIPLFIRAKNKFNYTAWCRIFEIDILNWHEKEKETIYKNYIDYGLECKFIKCVQEKGDIFESDYSIVSRYSHVSALEKSIFDKIVRFETGNKTKKPMKILEGEIISELLKQQTRDSGNSLISDFA